MKGNGNEGDQEKVSNTNCHSSFLPKQAGNGGRSYISYENVLTISIPLPSFHILSLSCPFLSPAIFPSSFYAFHSILGDFSVISFSSREMEKTTESATSQQFFLFRSQILNRRLNDDTIRVLESALASKDVKSLLEARSSVKGFLRRESLCIIREAVRKSVDEKLLIVEFLVRAFALIGDIESCLSLRYEAFILRDQMAAIDERLKVSHDEWLVFSHQCFDNGFHSIANKACEKVLCSPINPVGSEKDELRHSKNVIEEIKALKEAAMYLSSSQSVQVFTAEYMKNRPIQLSKQPDAVSVETHSSGSTLFRNGIKQRNIRKLHQLRRAQQNMCTDKMPLYFQST